MNNDLGMTRGEPTRMEFAPGKRRIAWAVLWCGIGWLLGGSFGLAAEVPPILSWVGSPVGTGAAGVRVEVPGEAGLVRVFLKMSSTPSSFETGRIIWAGEILVGSTGLVVRLPRESSVGASTFFQAERAPADRAAAGGMVWAPSGRFWMGSPDDENGRDADEGVRHEVVLTRGFWVGKHEVTQREYLEAMGENPSYFTAANGYGDDLDRPVEQVNWDDAVRYCEALTMRERGLGRIGEGEAFRLPTEAEWEYACRAGTTTAYWFGGRIGKEWANFDWTWEHDVEMGFLNWPAARAPQRTLRVGSFPANPFGLYDVAGNVWEWVWDWHNGPYGAGMQVDPSGPSEGIYKIVRGGGWHIYGWHCRSANRSIKVMRWERVNIAGFRVVLSDASRVNGR